MNSRSDKHEYRKINRSQLTLALCKHADSTVDIASLIHDQEIPRELDPLPALDESSKDLFLNSILFDSIQLNLILDNPLLGIQSLQASDLQNIAAMAQLIEKVSETEDPDEHDPIINTAKKALFKLNQLITLKTHHKDLQDEQKRIQTWHENIARHCEDSLAIITKHKEFIANTKEDLNLEQVKAFSDKINLKDTLIKKLEQVEPLPIHHDVTRRFNTAISSSLSIIKREDNYQKELEKHLLSLIKERDTERPIVNRSTEHPKNTEEKAAIHIQRAFRQYQQIEVDDKYSDIGAAKKIQAAYRAHRQKKADEHRPHLQGPAINLRKPANLHNPIKPTLPDISEITQKKEFLLQPTTDTPEIYKKKAPLLCNILSHINETVKLPPKKGEQGKYQLKLKTNQINQRIRILKKNIKALNKTQEKLNRIRWKTNKWALQHKQRRQKRKVNATCKIIAQQLKEKSKLVAKYKVENCHRLLSKIKQIKQMIHQTKDSEQRHQLESISLATANELMALNNDDNEHLFSSHSTFFGGLFLSPSQYLNESKAECLKLIKDIRDEQNKNRQQKVDEQIMDILIYKESPLEEQFQHSSNSKEDETGPFEPKIDPSNPPFQQVLLINIFVKLMYLSAIVFGKKGTSPILSTLANPINSLYKLLKQKRNQLAENPTLSKSPKARFYFAANTLLNIATLASRLYTVALIVTAIASQSWAALATFLIIKTSITLLDNIIKEFEKLKASQSQHQYPYLKIARSTIKDTALMIPKLFLLDYISVAYKQRNEKKIGLKNQRLIKNSTEFLAPRNQRNLSLNFLIHQYQYQATQPQQYQPPNTTIQDHLNRWATETKKDPSIDPETVISLINNKINELEAPKEQFLITALEKTKTIIRQARRTPEDPESLEETPPPPRHGRVSPEPDDSEESESSSSNPSPPPVPRPPPKQTEKPASKKIFPTWVEHAKEGNHVRLPPIRRPHT